ncbi:hypothetical protein LZG73_07200 [Dyadobacter sp. CY326]|nr:hypothetical protein [Dyadobacter sp. CY326]
MYSLHLCGVFSFVGCKNRETNVAASVRIVKSGSGYILLRNGRPFEIRGAGGMSNFRQLQAAGGNALRVWDTTNLQQLLDSAQAHNIAVIVGLPIQNSEQLALYNDPAKAARQLSVFKTLISRLKNHPALLMWCLGNELDFPFKPAYGHFYDAFNALTDMIHQEDPNHPITTTVLNLNQKYIANIQLRCDIDIISFNIFNRIGLLREDLDGFSWFWNGPYMLLEWGTDGPWEGSANTAWGAFIENPSKKKADVILHRYQEEMPVEDPRFLGHFIFYWGSKQETTHTWFSMFDESGRKSEPVAIMEYLWTGKTSKEHYPQIRYMLLNKKGAADNILLKPGQAMVSELNMHDSDSIRSVKWEIFSEDWYKENRQNSTRRLAPLDSLITSGATLKAHFKSPMRAGPYRIFAKISDYNGNFATCNTPFYVVSDQ